MLEQIAIGLSSLNAAKDIAKGLDSLKTSVAVNQAKIDLQNLIAEAQQGLFTAQQAQFEAAQRIRELEQKLMDFENWETEKQRYELADAGQGTMAYRPKAGMENGEPAHWLCAQCFQHRKKAFLQPEERNPGRNSYLCCATCGAEMITQGGRNIAYGSPGRGGGKRTFSGF
jgi:hypothetical protein